MPSLVPTLSQEPFYIVLAAFGKLGQAYVERSPEEATWQSTVRMLAEGEWNDVRQVVEVDLGRGTAKDVTEKALLAAKFYADGAPMRLLCVDNILLV